MLDYPLTLTIRVLNELSGEAIAQVAVIVTLFAAKKNDYHIARVTNADGEIPLTIEEVRQSIDCDRALFLMDYASRLEECSREIAIEVCSSEQIKRTVEAMEMYREVTDIDETLIDSFKTSVNGRYVAPVVQRFEINGTVSRVQIRIKPLAI